MAEHQQEVTTFLIQTVRREVIAAIITLTVRQEAIGARIVTITEEAGQKDRLPAVMVEIIEALLRKVTITADRAAVEVMAVAADVAVVAVAVVMAAEVATVVADEAVAVAMAAEVAVDEDKPLSLLLYKKPLQNSIKH